MPDPWVYAWSLTAAAVVSLLGGCVARRLDAGRARVASFVEEAATAAAVLAGCVVIGLQVRWPPASGLSRLFLIVLPAVVALAWRFEGWRGRVAWGALCLAAPWALWWKSVHAPATAWETTAGLAANLAAYSVSVVVLGGTAASAVELSSRSDRRVTNAVLSASLLTAGMLIAMAGYLQGGAASVPLAGALAGSCLVARAAAGEVSRDRIAAWGAASLWGVLFVGRFFGAITTADALVVAAAPSLGWAAWFAERRGASRRWTLIFHGMLVALVLGGWLAWGFVVFRERLGRLA